ncbi:Uncharacterized protein TCM_025609 [Theobroma cacao]|uniref:Uncharacterized protein n=1 Tax=Theobroma cacao TaxID=3641 RepID=A0A061EZM7_THECC|nr:Uncharacterized protein TCM_025609 [Theobroma cacao]
MKKFTIPFLGTKKLFKTTYSITLCGNTKCAGGCLLSPSKITAFKKSIFYESSSSTSSFPSPTTPLIFSNSFS